MTTEPKEVSVLKSQVTKLENQAEEISITTPEENVLAIDLKAKLRDLGKQIKERKEEITKPLNVALKSARELFAPLEQKFEDAENIVGRKLLAYKKEQDDKARIEEERIAKRVEKGTLKLETAERKMEEIVKTDKTVQTDHGRVQFRTIKKMRVVDANLVPDKYWEINETLLRKDVLAGIVVPGAELYTEEIV